MHPIEYKLKILTEELKDKGYSNQLIRNILKEYIQDLLLYIIYSNKEYKDLIFYGGTCLRKIYGLNRLSEDLDFETNKDIDLEDLKNIFLEYFKVEKFDKVSALVQSSENVSRCTLKFEILNTLGLSDKENEKLHVKIEINRTDNKYDIEYTPYSKDIYSMVIKHYPLSVLMSTKMLACIFRVFKKGNTGISIKGRDFYDLVWYMGKGVVPDERVFEKNKLSSKKVFSRIDDIVKDIKSNDLLLDLEPLFDNNMFINDWCTNFHSFYIKYRDRY